MWQRAGFRTQLWGRRAVGPGALRGRTRYGAEGLRGSRRQPPPPHLAIVSAPQRQPHGVGAGAASRRRHRRRRPGSRFPSFPVPPHGAAPRRRPPHGAAPRRLPRPRPPDGGRPLLRQPPQLHGPLHRRQYVWGRRPWGSRGAAPHLPTSPGLGGWFFFFFPQASYPKSRIFSASETAAPVSYKQVRPERGDMWGCPTLVGLTHGFAAFSSVYQQLYGAGARFRLFGRPAQP